MDKEMPEQIEKKAPVDAVVHGVKEQLGGVHVQLPDCERKGLPAYSHRGAKACPGFQKTSQGINVAAFSGKSQKLALLETSS